MDLNTAKSRLEQSGVDVAAATRGEVSKALGITKDRARHILDKLRAGADLPETKLSKPAEKIEQTSDKLTYELPSTTIHTLDELIEYFKVDTSVWAVDRWVANKWEVGAKDKSGEIQVTPLYQVKASFKRVNGWNAESVKTEIERLKELAKSDIAPFNVNKKYKHSSSGRDALEISMYDLHLGKLAWSPETLGANYDLKIAQKVGRDAFDNLLSRNNGQDIGRICLVVGQDFINSDNVAGTTTRGTSVSGDGRYHKLFQAGFDLVRYQVERCLQVAPVEVVSVVGNHDTHVSWHIAKSIECLYAGNRYVSVDSGPSSRKYWSHGNTMLMFTHGNEEKAKDLPMIMATERPDLFGSSVYREAHLGHKHQVNTFESFGVRVRIIPSLTPPDAWHAKSGYVGNLRAAQSFLWSEFDGLKTINEYNVKPYAE